MRIETAGLILRPWEEADAESLYLYAKDPDVGPVAGWPCHTSVENSLYILTHVLNGPECYAICLKEDNKAIGSVELKLKGSTDMTEREDECELGYWLGKPFWGKGYMPEAARALLRRAFADLGMRAVWCGYYDGNTKSKRVQEKLGFAYHHTTENIELKLLNEIRTGHVNLLTKERWLGGFCYRPLKEEEILAAHALAWDEFTALESPYYESAGTEMFRKCVLDENHRKKLTYYGAFDGPTLIGMLSVHRALAHIHLFFVARRYRHLGVATCLFARMKKDFPCRCVTLNASPYGKPFYLSMGFKERESETTVRSGIHYTPMVWIDPDTDYRVVNIDSAPELKDIAADWFASHWDIPRDTYRDSIEQSNSVTVPSWYLCLNGERIVGGLGVIENDFHNRKDLTPNVCALYTDPFFRRQGIAAELLDYVCYDMHMHGIDTLYLITDRTGFYEHYSWDFLCYVTDEKRNEPMRMYVHHYGV